MDEVEILVCMNYIGIQSGTHCNVIVDNTTVDFHYCKPRYNDKLIIKV